jgi:hypothetical protein
MRRLLLMLALAGCAGVPNDINWEVNLYPYQSDIEQYGTLDFPGAISVTGKGDCEDYAIEKYIRLEAKGYCPVLIYKQDHMAVMVDGMVLDMNGVYKYVNTDWTKELGWNGSGYDVYDGRCHILKDGRMVVRF